MKDRAVASSRRLGAGALALVLALVAAAVVVSLAPPELVPAGAATGPFDMSNVTDSFVAGGNWTNVVSAGWLANGHMLVLAKAGQVYDVNPATGAQSTVLDISAKVYDQGEAGAMSLLVDQAGTGFYLYYAVDQNDRLRISHFTVGSSTEQVIWNHPGLGYDEPYHIGGYLDFGADGRLYLGIGDQTRGLSQDLTNVFGKILRINTDGTTPTDNPFYDGAGPNVDAIWAYGLRNPYRGSVDTVTGRQWIADVGGNVPSTAYEELNIGARGANYGWPDCEGPVSAPKNGPVCPSGVTGPAYSYAHDPTGSQFFNRAIVGGDVYRGDLFPLSGHYLYADYPTHTFHWLKLGTDGQTPMANGLMAEVGEMLPVWLGAGPDGYVYWLSLGPGGDGQLRKLGYAGSTDGPPTITAASATPTSGTGPLAVDFTGAATSVDGSTVTYAWDFGDGTGSNQANPSHTYSDDGVYRARLSATSAGGTTSSNLITITVGAPPTATITSPADGATFDAGDVFTFNGSGFDPDTSSAITGSGLSWTVLFLHDAHSHPAATGTGSKLTFAIPRTGHDYTGNTRYLVQLTARNAAGLSTTTSITVWPNKVEIPVTSNAARTVTVDQVAANLPFAIDTVAGFRPTVAVPATECISKRVWKFASWSDGGARSHVVTAVDGLSLRATYWRTSLVCPAVAQHDPTGNFEGVSFGPSGIRVKGWALDRDSVASTTVHVYVDGRWRGVVSADRSRPDVGAAFPGYGSAHGFSGSVPAPAASGLHTVCVYAINVAGSPGTNPLLGCRPVMVDHQPTGNFEGVSFGSSGIAVRGWALDRDSVASTTVHVYVDGRWRGVVSADRSRPDVGAAFPGYGSAHGFSGTVPRPAGSGLHTVCVYAINVVPSPGTNPLLGCRTR
jgi:glucose/arabinose dehydrogenase/PKD repeat protein